MGCIGANRLLLEQIFALTHLSKLVIFNMKLRPQSVTAFEGMSALHVIEFIDCSVCDWGGFGCSLAQTPVKAVSFRDVECDLEDIESFLASVKLDRLYLSNFTTILVGCSPVGVCRAFDLVFGGKKENPRLVFLIEQDGYTRNLRIGSI